METQKTAVASTGIANAVPFSRLARGVLALAGLAALIAVGLTLPRELLLRHARLASPGWDDQVAHVAVGTILSNALNEAHQQEQRTVT